MTIRETGYSPEGQLIETRELKPGTAVVLTCDEVLPHPRMVGDKIPLTWFEVLEGENEIALYRRTPNTLEIERSVVGKESINGLSLRKEPVDPTKVTCVYKWHQFDPINQPVAIVKEPTKDSPIITEEITREVLRYFKLITEFKDLMQDNTAHQLEAMQVDVTIEKSKPGSVIRLMNFRDRNDFLEGINQHLNANLEILEDMRSATKRGTTEEDPEVDALIKRVEAGENIEAELTRDLDVTDRPRLEDEGIFIRTERFEHEEKVAARIELLRQQGVSLGTCIATVIVEATKDCAKQVSTAREYKQEVMQAIWAYARPSLAILDAEELLRTGNLADAGDIEPAITVEESLKRKHLAETYMKIKDPLEFVDKITSPKIEEIRRRPDYNRETDGLLIEGLDRGMCRFLILYEENRGHPEMDDIADIIERLEKDWNS